MVRMVADLENILELTEIKVLLHQVQFKGNMLVGLLYFCF